MWRAIGDKLNSGWGEWEGAFVRNVAVRGLGL